MSFDKEKEQLILALDLARIGFYDWDVVANSMVYNKHMLNDWGIADDSAMSLQEAIKCIHPDDQERVQKLVNDALEKKIQYSTEYRVIRPDGTIVWMDVNGIVKFDDEGNPIRFFGTSVNITERKQRELILEESGAMVRTFADSMPQMAFIADAGGSIIHFNQRWYEYISSPGTEGWGWKDLPVHHPEDLERTVRTWSHSVVTGEPYEIDYRLRRYDGEYRWHLGRALPFRNKNGDIVYWYGTNTDIHEERMSLERNRILYDFGFALSKGMTPQNIAETILTEGKKILKNTAGIVLFAEGDSFKVAASTNVPEDYFADDYFITEKRMPAKAALFEDRSFFLSNRLEILIEFPDFEKAIDRLDVRSLVSLPLKVQGKVLASVVFFLDVNKTFPDDLRRFFESLASQAAIAVDRAFLFQQQELQKEELRDAINARDEFFSVASHELKTPLTSMRLNGQLLLKRWEKKPETVTTESFFQFIHQNDKNVSKLVRLVDDMLDISRIRTGRIALRKEVFDICELTKEVVHRTQASTPSEVNLFPCASTTGNWDKLRIEQVITNLMSNAVRYGANRPVMTKVESKNGSVLISVKDNGIGIPKEILGTIFNRYERGPSGDIQGLGLGLYISRHIVESHGGRIWAESSVGTGSTFFVELPIT